MLLSSCSKPSVVRTECPSIPYLLTEPTSLPEKPDRGSTYRDVAIYAKSLEGQLYQCNLDKSVIRERSAYSRDDVQR
ncbi:Rz1-like lysis system protein LysC [Neptunomonas phycophila]